MLRIKKRKHTHKHTSWSKFINKMNNKLLYNELKKRVYLRDLRRQCSPSVVVYSSSSLSLPHLCNTPRCPLLSLTISLLRSSKQAPTVVVKMPPCRALVWPAVGADVEGQWERWEAWLPQVGSRASRGGDEGEVAVESPGRREGLREAAREQEGVRHRLDCCQETQRELCQKDWSPKTTGAPTHISLFTAIHSYDKPIFQTELKALNRL